MEVRRRVAETVGAEGVCGAAVDPEERSRPTRVTPNPLVEEGLKLYAEAERSGFREDAVLQSSLRYFLRAAEEGVEDASEWISSFLDSMSALPASVVLPPSLLNLLNWVKRATEEEREVCLVAEGMYRTMAKGRSSIPEAEFDEAVQNLLFSRFEHSPEIVKSAKCLKLSVKKLLRTAIEQSSTKEVTSEMFCEAAVKYAQGEVPHESGEVSSKQLEEFSKANILKKTLNYPVLTLHSFRRYVLKTIEHRGVKWIWASFPTKQFYLLLIAYILPMISAHFILLSMATIVFVGAFIAMTVATLQIILNAEKIFSFMEYSSIFRYFSEQGRKIDTRKPETVLIKRSALPYLTFSISVCLCLVALHLSHQQFIFYEVMCLLSALVTGIIFFQFECYKSTIFMVSASSRILGWLYVFLVLLESIIPIPQFLLYIGSTLFSIPVFPGFSISMNIITAVQLPLQCSLIAYFLYLNKWHNFYLGLGPYFLFLSWWVMCRYFFQHSSLTLLFWATLAILLLLVLVPFLPVLFLGSPIIFLIYYGLSRQFFISLCLVLIFGILLLFIGKFYGRLLETKVLNISMDYLILVQILVSIPLILLGANWFSGLYSPSNLPPVTLYQYSQYCGPHNWVGRNMAQTQLDCLHLQNRVLLAYGTVEAVRINDVTNSKEDSLKSLPTSVATVLACLFGQSSPMCGHRTDMETCKNEFSGCHFHHSNKYTFAISMSVDLPHLHPENDEDPISVTLLAPNSFSEVAWNLRVGTQLHFNATFVSGMGSDHLSLQLLSLEGIPQRSEVTEEAIEAITSQLMMSIRNTFAIIFDVILGYTSFHFD